MYIPFYQTEWHGINLVKLAEKLKHPLDKNPDSQFYQAFYQILKQNKNLDDDWVAHKRMITDWLYSMFMHYDLLNKNIISIGAGTGVIELPLLEQGVKIDLYDIQLDSFEILGANRKTNCYSGNLIDIPHEYDCIISIATCYAMSDIELEEFFNSTAQLIKKNGFLIILDASLSLFEIYSYLRNKSHYKKTNLIWGKKRSVNEILKYTKVFYKKITHSFYDEKISVVNDISYMSIPLNITPTWYGLILQRNDNDLRFN